MCRWFDSAPGHQIRKPLILNRFRGFLTSGMSLIPWFGTPSRYTVTTSTPRKTGPKIARLRRFMALPVLAPSGIFQFRRKVPLELRSVLGHEYKRSLKTRDPAEAEVREAEELLRYRALLANAQAQLHGAEALNARDIELLAAAWYHVELARMEASGDFASHLASGPVVTSEGLNHHEEHAPFVSLGEALEDDPDSEALLSKSVAEAIKECLRERNIPMPAPETIIHSRLTTAFRSHQLQLSDIALKRHHGDWLAKAEVLPAEALSFPAKQPVSPSVGKRLMALFEEYARDKILTDGDVRSVRKTILSFRATVTQFTELFGDIHVKSVTRDVIRQYRGYMSQLPAKGTGIRKLDAKQLIAKAAAEGLPLIEEATIRNKLRTISAVMGYALRMGEADENPVVSSGVAKAAAKAASNRGAANRQRKDYTRDELQQIFSSPIYTEVGWTAPRAEFGAAWYWMPLLMYYTGARREEIAQLATKEVLASNEGGWYLSILALDEDDAGRGVKTIGSRRLIPLHPHLIELGFLRYVESLEPGQLFPFLKLSPDGYYGTNFGKRWASYLRDTVGLRTGANPSHGFRHTFKTLSRTVGIPEDVHDAITGHAGAGSVSRDYGMMPLTRMAVEIAKYPHAPGLRPLVPILHSP